MKKEEKNNLTSQIVDSLTDFAHYYVTDISGLNAEQTAKLRKACFDKEIKLQVVKNTFFGRALSQKGIECQEISDILQGPTAVMFSQVANAPAKLIKQFHTDASTDRPILKAAFVDGCAYVGAEQLTALASLKSKEELIGDIINLLQSPAKNVISALQSAPQKIAGIVKTLEQR